jgi:transposase
MYTKLIPSHDKEGNIALFIEVRSEIPEETAALGRVLLDGDNLYRILGDQRADLVTDGDFIDLYSHLGGPALSPLILSLVLIFQMLARLPDRLAVEAVRERIDWKYTLHVPLDWKGFHFTNLSHFRQWLLEHDAEYWGFDQLLHKLVDLGFIRRRGKQRTDSTHISGQLAKLTRLELVLETLRMALLALEEQAEDWVTDTIPEVFQQRYSERRYEYDLKEEEIAAELRQAGADGFWLLQQVATAPTAVRALEALHTLLTVWAQQFEGDANGTYQGPREQLTAHGLVQSPHETEARYRRKRGKAWQGYVGQVTETAEEAGDPNFITDVEVTDAQLSDHDALPAVQGRLTERDLTPSEKYVDQAYVSGTQLAESQAQGTCLVGPVAGETDPKEYKLSDFEVDLAQQTATCLGGQQAVRWTTGHRSDGTLEYRAYFGEQCEQCPQRHSCTDAKAGRTITIHEHHAHVVQRRSEMQTEVFWEVMKRRPPVEGTISQLTRLGMRRVHYRGRQKANLQLILTATAVNLRRLRRVWATGNTPSWASAATG